MHLQGTSLPILALVVALVADAHAYSAVQTWKAVATAAKATDVALPGLVRSTIGLDPSITIALDSSILQRTGRWFNVSWEGVANPAVDDWLALMIPAGADPAHTEPVKYKMAAEASTHVTQGKGSLM